MTVQTIATMLKHAASSQDSHEHFATQLQKSFEHDNDVFSSEFLQCLHGLTLNCEVQSYCACVWVA